MPPSAQFCLEGAEHRVITVACIASIVRRDTMILEVSRGEMTGIKNVMRVTLVCDGAYLHHPADRLMITAICGF